MSRIFDELKKLKSLKSEPLPLEKAPPSHTESLKVQLAPKSEKSKERSLKLPIIILSVGVPLILGATLLPILLLKKQSLRRESPRMLVLSKQSRPVPKSNTKKNLLESSIEEITPSKPNVQEFVEIVPVSTQAATKAINVEALPITMVGVKPKETNMEVVELAVVEPPASLAAIKEETEKEEKPQIEIKAMPLDAQVRGISTSTKPNDGTEMEKPQKSMIEVKPLPPQVGEPQPPPSLKEEAVEPLTPEAAKEGVSPLVSEPVESALGGLTTPAEEEITAGLRKIQRVEKFKLALFYQKSGELKKAEVQYQELLKEDPMDAEVHNNLGAVYQEWGLYERAEAEFRKAVLLKPDYHRARNNLGVALYKKGNLEGALREFQTILEVNPRDIQSLTNLGVVLKKLGDIPRAREAFNRVLKMDPTHAETHYNLAIALEEEGEVAKAIYHYRKFLEFARGKYAPLAEEVTHHLTSIGWK